MSPALRAAYVVYALGILPACAVLLSHIHDDQPVASALAAATGVASVLLFSLSLVLMLRTRTFDRWFVGLDRLYQLHHRVGVAGFVCGLLHALLVLLSAAAAGPGTLSPLFALNMAPAVALGWLAVTLFSVFFLVTVSRTVSDRVWTMAHRAAAIAYGVVALHVTLLVDSLATWPSWLALVSVVVGAAALAYRFLLADRLLRDYLYTVAAVEHVSPTVVDVTLESRGERLAFEPGQYVYVAFRNSGGYRACGEFHPFTISSAPGAGGLHLVIKGLGRCTQHCQAIKPGVVAKVQGPFGQLFHDAPDDDAQVWIAAGIGITPFLSRLRSGVVRGRVDLYYLAKDRASALFVDELALLIERMPAVRFTLWLSSERAEFSISASEHNSSVMRAQQFYISGPPTLVAQLRRELAAYGVDAARIHTEDFHFR